MAYRNQVLASLETQRDKLISTTVQNNDDCIKKEENGKFGDILFGGIFLRQRWIYHRWFMP